jgi:hypothetical protein
MFCESIVFTSCGTEWTFAQLAVQDASGTFLHSNAGAEMLVDHTVTNVMHLLHFLQPRIRRTGCLLAGNGQNMTTSLEQALASL